MNARIDHLAVVADSLEQGARWCEDTFGVAPVAGGKHPLMGTHNRLLAISGERFPATYLEIIAIDPDAPAPPRPRWFAMDDAALRAAVREQPRLVHAIARTPMIEMLRWGLINCGIDPGVPIAMYRDTPTARLSWRITVRDDGRTACGGALPTLIQRDASEHPCDRLPAAGVAFARTGAARRAGPGTRRVEVAGGASGGAARRRRRAAVGHLRYAARPCRARRVAARCMRIAR